MAPPFTTRPELSGTFGMVASTHWLASGAGMAVLERGGNAFDAAVAAGLVLQVVEPHLNGPGGDMPAVVWDAARGEVRVLCGQGVAPARASIALLRDGLGLDAVPGTGLLAACVPGAFDAWMLMLRDLGTPAPARRHGARDRRRGRRVPGARADRGDDRGRRRHARGRVAVLGGGVAAGRPGARAGDRMANPDLARTYRRLVAEAEAAGGDRDGQIEHARAAWRTGWIAEAIVASVAAPSARRLGAPPRRPARPTPTSRGGRPPGRRPPRSSTAA